MVLETTFTTAGGTLVLRDALATGAGNDPHRLGAAAPRMLVRSLVCTAGEVEVAVEFVPRPEYGVVTPLISSADGGVMVRGGADVLRLCCSAPLDVADSAVTGRFLLHEGERAAVGLLHRTTSEPRPGPVSAGDLEGALGMR